MRKCNLSPKVVFFFPLGLRKDIESFVANNVSFFPVRQTPGDMAAWMNDRLQATFAKSGITFQAEYITSVRNWTHTLEKYSTLGGGYRKRHLTDTKDIPHSFTFARRDSILAILSAMIVEFKFCPWVFNGVFKLT